MAYCYGRQFRRIAAQAITADADEMRALIERILPPGENGGARVLRLETEADWEMAPAAIVAAFFADAISGDAAADLLAQATNQAARKQARQQERRGADDPLAAAIRAWGAEPTVRGQRPVRSIGDAPPVVNNNENTSAAPNGGAADRRREHPPP